MARRKTAAESTQRWKENAQNAVGAYKAGVESVKESPTIKAAENLDKMKAGFIRAIESGKTGDGLRSVSRDAWINATVAKGVDRFSGGIEQSVDKMENFQNQRYQYQTGVIDKELEKIPTKTRENMKQRMIKNFELMSSFRPKKLKR